jgi:hypothetical protein
MMRVFLVLAAMTLGLSQIAVAQDAVSVPRVDEAKEAEMAMKAKKRLYPGGRDEEELKVQAQLTTPVRKVSPQAEVKEEPSEE